MFLQRGFRCLKKKLYLCHKKESYERLHKKPEEKEEETHHQHHRHQRFPPLKVPKGFVPVIVGEGFEGSNKEGKKYMIQVEYLSTPTFKALIHKLWDEEEYHLHIDEFELEDHHNNQGPMKLKCSPADFEQFLDACDDELNCKKDRKSRRSRFSNFL